MREPEFFSELSAGRHPPVLSVFPWHIDPKFYFDWVGYIALALGYCCSY